MSDILSRKQVEADLALWRHEVAISGAVFSPHVCECCIGYLETCLAVMDERDALRKALERLLDELTDPEYNVWPPSAQDAKHALLADHRPARATERSEVPTPHAEEL